MRASSQFGAATTALRPTVACPIGPCYAFAMQIEQPTFPLSTTAFANALRTGHGRAMQQVEGYSAIGLSDAIVDACVSCHVHDPQCEANRAPWLFSLIQRAGLQQEIVQAIGATIKHPPSGDLRDMDQRCDILKELAAAGSGDARLFLYASLMRVLNSAVVIAADQIVDLDGENGLISVARQLGRWLQSDPDFWVDDGLILLVDESTGNKTGLAALEREAKVDPDVASYIDGVRSTLEIQMASARNLERNSYTGQEIIAHVTQKPNDRCYWFRLWGKKATKDHRETVFAALLASADAEHVKRWLRCFGITGVPRFDRRLLRWIGHPDQQLRWTAVRGLAPIKHSELRQAAVHLIADGEMAYGIALLVNNFEAGDFALCAKHLKRMDDADETHQLVGELLDLCEAHPGADALDCLLYVYELSPCSNCRQRAVKALIDTNTAPDWVLEEAAFDADPDTRALVAADIVT